MRSKKNLSLSDRVASASGRFGLALETFESAALDLEATSEEHAALADEALDEIERLSELHATALDHAEHADRVAQNVRSLIA